MAYCTNNDLTKYRPTILQKGVADWANQIAEAERQINRVLDVQWYRDAARDYGIDWRETPFDSTKLHEPEVHLNALACYKTLELAYAALAKETEEPDGYERHRDYYAKAYEEEFEVVLAEGIHYDWDADSEEDAFETKQTVPRRLKRG